MALVISDMSMSLDGVVTGPNDSRENPFGDGAGGLHDWLFDAATDADRALSREAVDGTGAVVMGRRSFDKCVDGPLDEFHVHVVPVLLGGGTRLFDTLGSAITLERTDVLVTSVTHLRFRVVTPS